MGGNASVESASATFDNPQDIVIERQQGNLFFFDNIGLRTLRATHKNAPQAVAVSTTEMPPMNKQTIKLRLIKGVVAGDRVFDSSFIVFDSNLEGYLTRVIEYRRTGKGYDSWGGSFFAYDSLNRPFKRYNIANVHYNYNHNLNEEPERYFRYDNKNHLAETGLAENELIETYQYNSDGDFNEIFNY